jgi:hypothetical protein
MRTVRMFTTYAGTDGTTATPGETVALEDERAGSLVDSGYAEYADEPARPMRRMPKSDAPETSARKPIDRMNVAELRAYAAEHDIDLGGATVKRDILAAVEAAQDADE